MKRINLLHLITELEPAGAENLLLNIARRLDRSKFKMLIGYIYGAGTLANQFRRVGVRVIDLSYQGKLNPFLLLRLILLMRKEKIEIIHTHLVHASIVGRIAARLAGVKAIVTTRHYAYHPKERNFMFRLEKKLARLSKMTVAISRSVKDYLVRVENYERGKVTIIYNAVDPQFFHMSTEESGHASNDNYRIGSVGHLYSQKGHDVSIKSMVEIIKEFSKTKLLIIGDGPLRNRLNRLIQELKLSNNVILLGSKSPKEVKEILKEINVFILASNWEGFGIAAIEAMASGKPVVATNVEGLREVVKDGRTGFLVPPGQPKALAKKIILLLKNPSLCSQMGNEGRKRVETLFSLDGMINKLESLYLELIKQTAVHAMSDY
jgi:glycosyltransferase involved in cell wall biosynthesis